LYLRTPRIPALLVIGKRISPIGRAASPDVIRKLSSAGCDRQGLIGKVFDPPNW
jgi:hypothetical protein